MNFKNLRMETTDKCNLKCIMRRFKNRNTSKIDLCDLYSMFKQAKKPG